MITYDEEGTEEGITVVPVWKWLIFSVDQPGLEIC